MPLSQRLRTKVSKILRVFEGVYQVDFEASPRTTRFLPGQFLHLALDDFDVTQGYWPESRVFSIASQPKTDRLSILYSVKGVFTKRMEAELGVGREVWLKLPYGDFSIDKLASENDPLIFVSGGTGVSPFLPYLASLSHQTAQGRKLHHHHGVRSAGMLVFQDVLTNAARLPEFSGYLYIEEEGPYGGLEGWSTRYGRLSVSSVLTSRIQLGNQAKIFLSGPPAMIKSFKDELISNQIPVDDIKIDEWE